MSKIKKLASGVSWGAISTITVTGFQLMFMAVMARLLDPASFGLVAIANVCLRFFSYFAQMGVGPALIQKPVLEKGDIAAALSVSLGISCLFFLVVQISAPLFELFYDMPQLANVARALSLNFIIGGFSAVSISLMQRNTAFRSLAIIDVLSYVLGYGLVGMGAAYYGLEAWALVAAFLSQMTLTAILSGLAAGFSLDFRYSRSQRRHFLKFGGRYSFIGFTEFISASLDSLLIGKLLGATASGLYNRASLLANLPVQQPAGILTKALFPIMSAVGNQREKQIVGLQLSTLLVGSYAFAVSAGIYIAAADIVKVLLGEKWLPAVPILQMLSCAVGPSYISHIAGVTLDSLSRLRLKLLIQLCMLALICGLLAWAAPTGNIINIAAAMVIMEWVRLGAMTVKLSRLLRMPAWQILTIALCIGLVAASTGLSVYAVTLLLSPELNSAFRLGSEIAAGAAGLGIGFLLAWYPAVRLPAMRFLAEQSPLFARLFPKLAN
ncbi:MAG: lipopolysaccharide biosynthesis protein [Methylococcales bacterium]|nr:lipopolysaccharide biosynthesis protein [Methylococcales bacterium]